MQPPGALDVGQARQLRRDEARAEPQFLTQLDAVLLLDEEGVRAAVDVEAVHLFAEHDAADARTGFEEEKRDLLLMEFEGGCQAGNAASKDENLGGCAH